jgi:gas vesicle protein
MKIANEYIEKRLLALQLQKEIKDLESQILEEMQHGSYSTSLGTVSLVERKVIKTDDAIKEKIKEVEDSIAPKIEELKKGIAPILHKIEEEAKKAGLITEEIAKSLRFTPVKK